MSGCYGAWELKSSYQKNLILGLIATLFLLVCILLIAFITAKFFHPKVSEETSKRITLKLFIRPSEEFDPILAKNLIIPPLKPIPPANGPLNANLSLEGIDLDWPKTEVFAGEADFGERENGFGKEQGENPSASEDTLAILDRSGFNIKSLLLFKVDPPYPPLARNRRITGTVLAELVVGGDGIVRRVTIKESSNPIFEYGVKETLKEWIFRPLILGGRSYPFRINVSIDFVIFR